MRIDIISVLPELIESPFNASILRRAIDKELIEVFFHDLKDYSSNKRKQVDDYQFGGGSGMVLMIEPIKKCIDSLKSQRDYDEVIYMSRSKASTSFLVVKVSMLSVRNFI